MIISAAGNRGCDCLDVPGALPSVLAVGAMDSEGHPLDYSNWGSKYSAQGILAPGDRILGAVPGGGTTRMSGTSIATPIVSGVAALLLSLQLKRGLNPDPKAVTEAILQSALGCDYQETSDCRRLLAGRLNVHGAVEHLKYKKGEMDERNEGRCERTGQIEGAQPRARIIASNVSDSPELEQGSLSVTESSSPAPSIASLAVRSDQRNSVVPSACSCSGEGGGRSTGPRQLVYALGQLGFDFGTEARRDSFVQAMDETAPGVPAVPYNPQQLLAYLQENPWDAASLIWTLSLDSTPVYAVLPAGPYAATAYERLRRFLSEQLTEGVERISVPGVLAGSITLLNGQLVPAIVPELRGMFSWNTAELVKSVVGPAPELESQMSAHQEKILGVHNFLDRVYFELRNLGLTPEQRAINFAATNAFNIETVYQQAMKEHLDLDTIEVERSPVCRPESDCWDVKLMFFFPERQVQTVRRAYRFTIDVSDVVPVTIGPVRSWFVR